MFNKEVYLERRNLLKKELGKGKIFFPGSQTSPINFKDNYYPFRQDSNFLYFFGIRLPGLFALIDIDKDEEIIFGQESTMDDIIWTGQQKKLSALADSVGITKVLPLISINSYVDKNIRFLPPYRPDHVLLLHQFTSLSIQEIENNKDVELILAVAKQRSVKSQQEIALINKAVTLTHQMHREVILAAKPGMKESELVGIAQKYAWQVECRFAFSPIMTIQGNVLHNHQYHHTIQNDQMVLFDGGLEIPEGYCGDITRTFPAGKNFNSAQADIYDVVHNAVEVANKNLRPGIKFIEIHRLTCIELVAGLIQLGIFKGDPEELVENDVHTLLYQCGTGHFIGLDVHDMESFGEEWIGYDDSVSKKTTFGWKSLRLGKALQPGNVLTVEPGIYFIPEWIDTNKKNGHFSDFVNYENLERYRYFGGIRIENNYYITENGAEILGDPLPVLRKEVEGLRHLVAPPENPVFQS